MSRPVKGEHEQLACWIPAATMKKLDGFVERTNLSKREILTAALEAYFVQIAEIEQNIHKEASQ